MSRSATVGTVLVLCLLGPALSAEEIIIQENDLGFCNVDGAVLTSVSGYTGDGYADTDRGVDKSVSWSIHSSAAGTVYVQWRYANGGGSGARPGELLLNGASNIDSVDFPHTGEWTNWVMSDSVAVDFVSGTNKLRLEAHSPDGLGNIDYIKLYGNGISATECTPSYTLEVLQNESDWGTIFYAPVQSYYEEGTEVTLQATPSTGYFFQSWSGDVTSNAAEYTFSMENNVVVEAIFLPDATTMDAGLYGYATVQDDKGTTFLVIGGMLGDTVTVSTVEDLQTYLGSAEPSVVQVNSHIIGDAEVKVTSDKTLIGVSPDAHLEGIELEINGARNVIIRDLKISHVTPADAIIITGGSENVWIDHCDLYSDRDHGKDYYDGLLDIKNESSFITISWTKFHDHFKTSLIASGDESVQDSVIRVTYHHNHFYNCESRLPSIRFGRAHIFNNYYSDCETAINSRMGACVRVERNNFRNVGTAVMMAYSPEDGAVELLDNHFGNASVTNSPTCQLDVPYEYNEILDPVEDVPAIVTSELATDLDKEPEVTRAFQLDNYPNPFNAGTTLRFSLPTRGRVTLEIYNILGDRVATVIDDKELDGGAHAIPWVPENLPSGLYFSKIRTPGHAKTEKMVLLK